MHNVRRFVAMMGLVALFSRSDVSAAPSTAPSTTPATTSTAVRTDHDLVNEMIAFEKELIVDAYAKQGHHDPRWGAIATRLIDAQHVAPIRSKSIGRHYGMPAGWPSALPVAERLALANQLLDTPCDDAIPLYMAGRLLDEENQPRRIEAFDRANAAAIDSPYVPALQLAILETAHQLHMPELQDDPRRETDPAVVARRARRIALMPQVLSDVRTFPKYRAAIYQLNFRTLFDMDNADADSIANQLPALKDPDPWLYNLYMGEVEISRAWLARGNDYAYAVKAEGWQGFEAHIDKAKVLFERANDADTRLPHAAARLITVAMAQSNRQEIERWYRAATERQVDDQDAFDRYAYALRPKWLGSVDQQIELAAKCVATRRFDTRVPAFVLKILDDLEEDNDARLSPDEASRLLPLVCEAMEGYARADSRPEVQLWANSTHVAWLAVAERWADARVLLDAMPTTDFDAVWKTDVELYEMHGLIMAMSNPAGPAIAAAMATRDPAERVKKLDEISSNFVIEPHPEAKRARSPLTWLKRRRDEAAFDVLLASGEWTTLPIDPELASWRCKVGDWKSDGANALIGTTKNGLELVGPFQFPERYEFRCTIELQSEPTIQNYGIRIYPAWSMKFKAGAYLDFSGNVSSLRHWGWRYEKFSPERSGNSITLHFRYDRGTCAVLDEANRSLARKTFAMDPVRRIGIEGYNVPDGVTWRISDMAVKKLKD